MCSIMQIHLAGSNSGFVKPCNWGKNTLWPPKISILCQKTCVGSMHHSIDINKTFSFPLNFFLTQFTERSPFYFSSLMTTTRCLFIPLDLRNHTSGSRVSDFTYRIFLFKQSVILI